MQLQCVERMIPYFHASGHFAYAKSSHLYLQQMRKLQSCMSEYEFDRITEQSFFTVRRTEKFWSGVWTDMLIEQSLMRLIKSRCGLTQGRGLSDAVVTPFLLTAPMLVDVCNEVEEFCNIYSIL